MVPWSSQGVSCDSGWDLGTQNHTKYKVGRSLQEGLWFLLSWFYGLHFLPSADLFPTMFQLAAMPRLGAEVFEHPLWASGDQRMEHQAKKPRTGAFPSQHLKVQLRSWMIIRSEENGTQSTPRLGMVRDGSWLWLYRKLVSRCFNCPRLDNTIHDMHGGWNQEPAAFCFSVKII